MSGHQVVDLFAGAGGWEVGMEMLGLDSTSAIGIETDADACATREAWGLETVRIDVRALGPDDFRGAVGLIASPPCQTFSAAGKGSGRRELDAVLQWLGRVARGDGLDYAAFEDHRTGLVLEPLRWAMQALKAGRPYQWIALEQVPAVLPVWEQYAMFLRQMGYWVWVGKLSAEEYGVPQTRKRAVLMARLGADVGQPPRTHRTYRKGIGQHEGDPSLRPWVSMVEALGWGSAEWADPANRGIRRLDEPAATVSSKVDRNLVVRTGQMSTVRRGGGEGSTRPYERDINAPAPTLDTKAGRWHLRRAWAAERPATTAAGDARIWPPGHKVNADDRRRHADADERYGDRAGTKAIRVSVEEAALLQSFPAGYPWQGRKGSRSRQVGNAMPPRLAAHVLHELGLGQLPETAS